MMMGDQFRKMDSSTYSPKSSPHGGRSPVVSRQDSSGTLKTTISLGKTPTIIQTGPFYSMKEPPGKYFFLNYFLFEKLGPKQNELFGLQIVVLFCLELGAGL